MFSKMNYLPLIILAAAIIHIIEEFFYPGGFIDFARKNIVKNNRRIMAEAIDSNMAVIVNALFLLLCLVNVLISGTGTLLHYSLVGLILFNSLFHIAGSIIIRKYSPGLITSVLIYIPLAVYIISNSNKSGDEMLIAMVIGILLNLVPIIIVLVRSKFVFNYKNKVLLK